MHLTRHAEHRSIKRNIPMHVMDAIYEFGSPRPSRGLLSLTLDRKAIDLAAEDKGRRRHELCRYSGTYLIVDNEEQIVTVARRTRRFRH